MSHDHSKAPEPLAVVAPRTADLRYAQGDYQERLSPFENVVSVLSFIMLVAISIALLAIAVVGLLGRGPKASPPPEDDLWSKLFLGTIATLILASLVTLCASFAYRVRALRICCVMVVGLDALAFLVCAVEAFI